MQNTRDFSRVFFRLLCINWHIVGADSISARFLGKNFLPCHVSDGNGGSKPPPYNLSNRGVTITELPHAYRLLCGGDNYYKYIAKNGIATQAMPFHYFILSTENQMTEG